MYELGMFAGALGAGAIVSLGLRKALGRVLGGRPFILNLAVHIGAIAITSTVAAFGNADGGPLNWSATPYYLTAQGALALLQFTAWRYREAKARRERSDQILRILGHLSERMGELSARVDRLER